ncbi:hypothetical protein Tco_0049962, partial [Tanacetum coccineum]
DLTEPPPCGGGLGDSNNQRTLVCYTADSTHPVGCGQNQTAPWWRGEEMEVVTVGWRRWRVEESGCGDRIDPVMRSVFGVGRKSHRKSFPVAGDGGGGGGGVAGGGRSN